MAEGRRCGRHARLRPAGAGVKAWLTQAKRANNAAPSANAPGFSVPPKSLPSAATDLVPAAAESGIGGNVPAGTMLAQRRQSFKLWVGTPCRTSGHWMVSRACLHRTGNKRLPRICRFEPPRGSTRPPFAMPRDKTCSIFTPLSSWRSQYSFSCGFAAFWDSVPAASGRPRSLFDARCGAQPGERQGGDPADATGRGRAGRRRTSRPRRRLRTAGRVWPRLGRRGNGARRHRRRRIRTSTSSISSPARAPPTK